MTTASLVVALIELTLTQPNGFTFTAKARGNINHHWVFLIAAWTVILKRVRTTTRF
ncbi:MAG: hypothetical protein ACI9FJ_000720 [Alteromonadaceae bacterium]|jgi:hypothetical protein